MRSTGFLGALLVLMLAAGPAVAAPKRPEHGLTANANPIAVTFGASTVVSGMLLGSNHGNQVVTLAEDTFPYAGYAPVATTRTAASGYYSFRRFPDSNRSYRAVGTIGRGGWARYAAVYVRMRVSRRVSDRTPRRGQVVSFSGFVAPKHDRRLVRLQRRSRRGRWVTVRRVRLRAATGNRSAYTIRRAVRSSGTYRTLVLGHADHLTGTSARIKLSVG